MFSLSEQPPSSLTWLDEELRVPVLDPRKFLRCDKKSAPRDISNAFRLICLEHLQGELFDPGSLSIRPLDMVSWRVTLFSYRLTTKQFVGESDWFGSPSNASMKELGELSRSSLLMDFKPRDILHELRPTKCIGLEFNENLRACAFLGVSFQGWETEQNGIGLHTNYIFQVDYCMRRSIIKRRFSQFLEFQTALQQEVPIFTDVLVGDISHRLLIGDRVERGRNLASFIMSVHQLLAERGLFSPRLLAEFLGIDPNKIHAEEEKVVASILDSTVISEVSTWAMIDESWLTRWRYFATSRGGAPPPGNISNDYLLVEIKSKRVPRDYLTASKDYRAIASNFYVYLQKVHGGGPCISRSNESIYSAPKDSLVGAVVRVQRTVRRYHDQRKYIKLEKHAYKSDELIPQMSARSLDGADLAESVQCAEPLDEVANFTQLAWRSRASSEATNTIPEMSMDFAFVNGMAEVASESAVNDLDRDIIDLLPGEIYEVICTKAQGLALGLTCNSTTGMTCVNRTRAFLPSSDSSLSIGLGSSLLRINDAPVRALSHNKIMERLRRNEWPLKLHFERPFQPGSVGDVFALAKTTDLVLQTQMFKALLKRGCRLNFHNDKGESINSMIWATTSQLIWRQEPKKRKLDLTAFVKKNGPWKTKKQAEVLRTAGIRSPSDLQVFAAQKSTMYNRTFEEIGLLSKDHERMFNATTSSLTETFTADMEGLSARCLYDFISVKAEKAFTFVIEFEKPMNVVRVGDRVFTRGKRAIVTEIEESMVQAIVHLCHANGKTSTISMNKAIRSLEVKKARLVLHFEVPQVPEQEAREISSEVKDSKRTAVRNVLVRCLGCLIGEANATRWGLSGQGEPVRRSEPVRKYNI